MGAASTATLRYGRSISGATTCGLSATHSASRSRSVLGYSFGGFVAQSYATRHPDHPAKLVLYSTTPVLDDGPVLDAFESIGGAEVRAIAAAYFADRTPENTAAFRATCFPLYNTKLGDPNLGLRWIVNNAVSANFFEGEGKRFDFGRCYIVLPARRWWWPGQKTHDARCRSRR